MVTVSLTTADLPTKRSTHGQLLVPGTKLLLFDELFTLALSSIVGSVHFSVEVSRMLKSNHVAKGCLLFWFYFERHKMVSGQKSRISNKHTMLH